MRITVGTARTPAIAPVAIALVVAILLVVGASVALVVAARPAAASGGAVATRAQATAGLPAPVLTAVEAPLPSVASAAAVTGPAPSSTSNVPLVIAALLVAAVFLGEPYGRRSPSRRRGR
jgi:hypothetical protein